MGKMLARGFHGSLCLFAPWRHPLSSKKLITPGDDGDVLAQNYAQNKIKKNPQTMHTIYIPTNIYIHIGISLFWANTPKFSWLFLCRAAGLLLCEFSRMSGHWPRGRHPQNFPTSLAVFSLP